MALLEYAARTIPMGTAYAVWGGIGALGTVLVGIAFFGEPSTIDTDAADPRPRRLHRRPEADRMSIDEGLYAWVAGGAGAAGPVTMRKMMGGATLYLDGIVFAVLDEGELWFKADAESATRSGTRQAASASPSPSRTAKSRR